MSATSTSGAAAKNAKSAVAAAKNPISVLSDDSGVPNFTQAVAFSSGNPSIEETRGIMYLYPQGFDFDHNLTVGRKAIVCVLAVPNHMTYADFCGFCGSFVQYMLEMRIVRTDGVEDQYSVIIRFDDQNSTDSFYGYYNGKRFSSMEVDVCEVRYTFDVQYTGSIEHAQISAAGSAEPPTCPVCLERLDQDASGILTTICNHSFHCSCISKWTDSSCPVCRYCQQQPGKSTCSLCGTSENLWMCVICGFVSCGRYKEGHAIIHWKDTQHCYSLELETQRVWDYVGDNYVHRLIQSKTDGKLVELNVHDTHAADTFGDCECSAADSGFKEAILDSKLEAIITEYNDLLTSQLENQRKYYESRLHEIKEEMEREALKHTKRVEKIKLHKVHAKFEKCNQEKKFLHEINENLVKNEGMWQEKYQEIEKREQDAIGSKNKKIQMLEKQMEDLRIHIENQNPVEEPPSGSVASEVKDGEIVAAEADMQGI